MTTEWANLPNAVHIDRVIASAIAHPDHWKGSWATPAWDDPRAASLVSWAPLQITQDRDAAYNAARQAARKAARYKLQEQGRGPAWVEGWDPVRMELQYITWFAAGDAIVALVAYDDCAYMLDSDPSELAILAKLGDNRASLVLAACKAFHSLKLLLDVDPV